MRFLVPPLQVLVPLLLVFLAALDPVWADPAKMSPMPDPAAENRALKIQLEALQGELADSQKRATDWHSLFINMRDQVGGLQATIQKDEATMADWKEHPEKMNPGPGTAENHGGDRPPGTVAGGDAGQSAK